jgi:hypothetical protein
MQSSKALPMGVCDDAIQAVVRLAEGKRFVPAGETPTARTSSTSCAPRSRSG